MIIGIDLGTTNSLVGYYKDGEAKLIPNVFGEYLTPSVVSVKGDTIVVGALAKERLITHPLETFGVFKRTMGTNKTYDVLGKHSFTSIELSSFILKQLKEDAEAFLGEECKEGVISVPAYFNSTQREATKFAAQMAGLEVLSLISEPTAAALAYGIRDFKNDSITVVLDLGGGTFDISVLEMYEGVLEVLAISGNNHLGGEDFTQVLIRDFLEKNSLEEKKLTDGEKALLYLQCEKLKINLKGKGGFDLKINGREYTYEIEEEEYYELCQNIFQELKKPIIKALNDSKTNLVNVNYIILMGGSTKLGVVHRFLEELFKRELTYFLDPDQTVALGAILNTGLILNDEKLEDYMLTDVCGFSIGIEGRMFNEITREFENGCLLPVITRNTTIPCSIEESFAINESGANAINTINIYQGDHKVASKNTLLGSFNLDCKGCQDGELFTLRFTYDGSGVLDIEAVIVRMQKKFKFIITEESALLDEAAIKKRIEFLNELKLHPRDNQENELLLAKCDRLIEMANREVADYLFKLKSSFQENIDKEKTVKIKKYRNDMDLELTKIESYLENVLNVEVKIENNPVLH